MTMQGDHHISKAEDAAFDKTMKIGAIVVAISVLALAALWYFSA